jgi:3-oxosteroid 1-dehydrogenase
VVDDKGRRFANESEDYYLFGEAMIRHGVRETWLILDARHRKRYTFGAFLPGQTPQAMVDVGFFRKADTVDGIAWACGMDPAGLQATVERFNGFAKSGVDADFGRGDRGYDRFWGDPQVKPNPNLGPIEQGPFLAAKVHLSDLGTKGGYVTDRDGAVLDVQGRPIEGLYATGNCTASLMGRYYPGPGVTLGPAMTYGYISMNHAARRLKNAV